MTATGRAALRLGVAVALPVIVPGAIVGALWALPGDPAELVCPPGTCTGTEALAARWNLDAGPWGLWTRWMAAALGGDLGQSWRVLPGVPVGELVGEAVPVSLGLWTAAGLLVVLGGALGAWPGLPRAARAAMGTVGALPALLLALAAAAVVDVRFGIDSHGESGTAWRLALAVPVLGLAEGALSGAVDGVRETFGRERHERYVAVARLRGEGELENVLPNLAPALAGQVRARLVGVLSASVMVEAALQLDGVGDLMWRSVLAQDFPVMLAGATVFAAAAGALLVAQAGVELLTAWRVRWTPGGLG